jgi:hypothetical protein
MPLPVQVATCFGVLEYWSIGVLAKRKPEFSLHWSFHYSITPADYRKGEKVWKSPQRAVQSQVLRFQIPCYTNLLRREKSWSTLCSALLYSARDRNLEPRQANIISKAAGDSCPSLAWSILGKGAEPQGTGLWSWFR